MLLQYWLKIRDCAAPLVPKLLKSFIKSDQISIAVYQHQDEEQLDRRPGPPIWPDTIHKGTLRTSRAKGHIWFDTTKQLYGPSRECDTHHARYEKQRNSWGTLGVQCTLYSWGTVTIIAVNIQLIFCAYVRILAVINDKCAGAPRITWL